MWGLFFLRQLLCSLPPSPATGEPPLVDFRAVHRQRHSVRRAGADPASSRPVARRSGRRMSGWRRLAIMVAMLLVAALPVAGCAAPDGPTGTGDSAMTFTNPVYPADAPDPQAIQVGDTWYLVHTNTGGQNVPVLTSPDLVNWTPAGDALPTLPSWADTGRTWAPEIIALAPDSYVLYYTAADHASGRECVGRAVATQPQGPYRDDSSSPLICPVPLGGAIDPSPYRDTDGSLWLLWKNDGNAIGADTWLWSQRLSDDGLRLVGEPNPAAEADPGMGGAAGRGTLLLAPRRHPVPLLRRQRLRPEDLRRGLRGLRQPDRIVRRSPREPDPAVKFGRFRPGTRLDGRVRRSDLAALPRLAARQ